MSAELVAGKCVKRTYKRVASDNQEFVKRVVFTTIQRSIET